MLGQPPKPTVKCRTSARPYLHPKRVSLLDAYKGYTPEQLRDFANDLQEPQPDGLTRELLTLRAEALEVGRKVWENARPAGVIDGAHVRIIARGLVTQGPPPRPSRAA
jgi:hypothetical protein